MVTQIKMLGFYIKTWRVVFFFSHRFNERLLAAGGRLFIYRRQLSRTREDTRCSIFPLKQPTREINLDKQIERKKSTLRLSNARERAIFQTSILPTPAKVHGSR